MVTLYWSSVGLTSEQCEYLEQIVITGTIDVLYCKTAVLGPAGLLLCALAT